MTTQAHHLADNNQPGRVSTRTGRLLEVPGLPPDQLRTA
ncbi:hypothetical protein J2S57_000718 [Kineosporia succinea]|uniref:Uncharacterized protein n=1 Tax=Kineosporia succinea TaxID=84632 RepID=A0ABT9NXU1_9ACTN|nr:hypothetical protein [Kineosporia succinea]